MSDDKDPIADALHADFTSASKEKDGTEEKEKTMGEKAEDAGAPKGEKKRDDKEDDKGEKKDKDDAKEASCGPMAKRPGPWLEKKDSTMSKKADLLDRTPGSYLEKR